VAETTPSADVEHPAATTTARTQPPVDDTPLFASAEPFAWTSFFEELFGDAAAQVGFDQLIVTQKVVAAADPSAFATLCPFIQMNAPCDGSSDFSVGLV
jgi:hypothetical protein